MYRANLVWLPCSVPAHPLGWLLLLQRVSQFSQNCVRKCHLQIKRKYPRGENELNPHPLNNIRANLKVFDEHPSQF